MEFWRKFISLAVRHIRSLIRILLNMLKDSDKSFAVYYKISNLVSLALQMGLIHNYIYIQN